MRVDREGPSRPSPFILNVGRWPTVYRPGGVGSFRTGFERLNVAGAGMTSHHHQLRLVRESWSLVRSGATLAGLRVTHKVLLLLILVRTVPPPPLSGPPWVAASCESGVPVCFTGRLDTSRP